MESADGQAAGRKCRSSGRGFAQDERAGASGNSGGPDRALRATSGPQERGGEHGLRNERADSSVDRLGEVEGALPRRGAGERSVVGKDALGVTSTRKKPRGGPG